MGTRKGGEGGEEAGEDDAGEDAEEDTGEHEVASEDEEVDPKEEGWG